MSYWIAAPKPDSLKLRPMLPLSCEMVPKGSCPPAPLALMGPRGVKFSVLPINLPTRPPMYPGMAAAPWRNAELMVGKLALPRIPEPGGGAMEGGGEPRRLVLPDRFD